MADSSSKYAWNALPYLGKDESRPSSTSYIQYIVSQLICGLEGKGYNMTCDKFFTSIPLAEFLLTKQFSLVGTIRECPAKAPKFVQEMSKTSTPQFWTEVYQLSNGMTLTAYKSKKTKVTLLLSSQYQSVMISSDRKMKLDTILAYNSGKFGVDCVDQKTKHYTSNVGSRWWPLAVFYNIIDISRINAWILYRECTKSKISRLEFLLKFSQQLCKFNQLSRVPKRPASQTEEISLQSAKRKQL